MGRRAPRPIGTALPEVLGEVEPRTPLAAVQRVWEQAVGAAIAAQAVPVAERDGVVTVACVSATWAQELDLLGDRLLAKLRAELPDAKAVRTLRFTATRE